MQNIIKKPKITFIAIILLSLLIAGVLTHCKSKNPPKQPSVTEAQLLKQNDSLNTEKTKVPLTRTQSARDNAAQNYVPIHPPY